MKYLIRKTELYTEEVDPPNRIDKDNETLTQKLEAFIDELGYFSAALRDIGPSPKTAIGGVRSYEVIPEARRILPIQALHGRKSAPSRRN